MTTDLLNLAEYFLGHLVREEASLRAAREGLGLLNESFTRGNFTDLQNTLTKVGDLAEHTQRTKAEREAVCQKLGEALDLDPETVHITAVASRLPAPYPARIASYRDRLQILAADVERLSAKTTAAVGFCRSFMNRVINEMTEGGASVTHYGPGPRRESNRGTLLVARG
jgi:hypothetical protein